MVSLLYKFDALTSDKEKRYIFQRISGRKLTDIYHSHDFYELAWLQSGCATKLVNGREMRLGAHDAVLMRPGDSHLFLSQTSDVDVISLSVKKEEFELVASLYGALLAMRICREDGPIILENVRALEHIPTASSECDYKWLLAHLLHEYAERWAQNEPISTRLEKAVAELKKGEGLRLGIPAFCALSGYSQSHLTRLVRQYFGTSLKEYINELRLQRAYGEIVLTQKPFEQIAEDVGFLSFSHFNKIFKARFAITPSVLRKQSGAWTV